MLCFIAEWVSVGQEAIITREHGVVGKSARVLFLGLLYPEFFLNKQNLRMAFFYWGGPRTKQNNRHSYEMRPVSVMGLACLVVAIAGTCSPAEPTLVLLACRDGRFSECRFCFRRLRSVS
jgi:hypothetical protein